MKQLKGIDVYGGNRNPDGSKSNPIVINWKQVKASGVQFAILRVTEKYGTDQQFKRNANRCEARGIPYGVYRYSYALTITDAVKEAKDVVKMLKGRKLAYPVFYDLEWNEQYKLSREQIEAITLAFFDVIVKAGFSVGIYCNVNWYRNKLTDKLKEYPLWIASYPNDDHGQIEERLRPSYGMGWQYSSHGTVPGVPVRVDMDIFYEDEADEDEDEPVDDDDEETDVKPEGITASDVLDLARKYIGCNEADGSHKQIVDTYNSHQPLAQGYKLTYYDSWCDCFISFLFILLKAVDLIGGTECGVERHIQLFKAIGIWEEDGSIVPEPGYIITYNWDENSQPNNGYADHIGIVESVSGNKITCIEGNMSGKVGRRTLTVGDGNIRGYAKPRYAKSNSSATASESSFTPSGSSTSLHKDPQCVGRVTAPQLPVKTWAGDKYDAIESYPVLNKDDLVDLCDAINGWYYIRIAGKYYGFVNGRYIAIV